MQTIKHLICCALLLVLAAGCAARPALKIIQRPPGIAEETGAITPPVPKRDFTAGESYRYRIDWLGVPVGIVYFDISGVKPLKGREVYVVTLRAETNKFASKIYRVEDSYTSYVDTERFIPLRYDVDRKEGGYRKRATTYFDHEGGEAHFENFLDGSKKTYKIPDGVLDPVSAILKARTLERRRYHEIKGGQGCDDIIVRDAPGQLEHEKRGYRHQDNRYYLAQRKRGYQRRENTVYKDDSPWLEIFRKFGQQISPEQVRDTKLLHPVDMLSRVVINYIFVRKRRPLEV